MNTNLETKQLKISDLINDLTSGLSWLKKDDKGVGSIQDKYEATDIQINVLRQHPKLKSIEEIKYNFTIIDDTIEGYTEDNNLNNEADINE